MAENPYQSPTNVPARSTGRVRTTLGVLLIALSLYLSARMLWLAHLVWSSAFEETRNRIVVFSFFGLMMALVGCWLVGRSRRASAATIVSILGTMGILYFLDCFIQAW
jgi:hypothetical protein